LLPLEKPIEVFPAGDFSLALEAAVADDESMEDAAAAELGSSV